MCVKVCARVYMYVCVCACECRGITLITLMAGVTFDCTSVLVIEADSINQPQSSLTWLPLLTSLSLGFLVQVGLYMGPLLTQQVF